MTVGDVRRQHSGREEDKGKDGFPEFNAFRWCYGDNDVQPQVGKDAPWCGDEEDTQVLDLSDLTFRDDGHTQTNDNEQVERCTADDRAWTKITGVEVVTHHLDDGEHDLRSRWAESHQSQVGDRLVPDSHVHHHCLAVRPVHSTIVTAHEHSDNKITVIISQIIVVGYKLPRASISI